MNSEMTKNNYKSQIELFTDIWINTKDKKCFVTGRALSGYLYTEFWLNCFAHVLSKNKYPEWRLKYENIVLLHPDVHFLYDNGTLDRILKYEKDNSCNFLGLFLLEKQLHEEYILETGKKRKLRNITQNYLTNKNVSL